MKTLITLFTIVFATLQLNAQNFIDTYIHIVPDYGGSTGKLSVLSCTDPINPITRTITFDGNPLPSGQATGINGSGIKVLHFTATDGISNYEFEANINFNVNNPSITYSITPSVEPMSIIQRHKSAAQNCDGEINLIVSGGNAPTSITWFQNGVPLATAPGQTSLLNLCAGSYGYSFCDASTLCGTNGNGGTGGNGYMFDVFIDELSCYIDTHPMSCHGVCDGVAFIAITGTNPNNITFLNIMNSFGDQDVYMLNNQCAGIITGQIMDNTGAMAQCDNVITEPALLDFVLSGNDATGYGLDNGSASVNVTFGDGPYSYDWTGPDNYTNTGNAIGNLAPGTYSLTITYNSNQCDTTITFAINEPSELIITINSITHQTANPPNGAIDFSVSGGVPPYSVTLDDGQTLLFDGPFSQLSAGTYTLKVVDDKGNIDDSVFTLNSYASLQEKNGLLDLLIYPNPASESVTIKGEELKSIAIYDMNGRMILSQSLTEQTTIDVSNIETGMYTVKVQSATNEHVEKLIIQ